MGSQLHKRFTDDQVKLIFKLYLDKSITLSQVLQQLGCKKRRFYQLLGTYKKTPDSFSVTYQRHIPNRRLNTQMDAVIKKELIADRKLINDPAVPISRYNYAFTRDRVVEQTRQKVSVQTIRNRAQKWGYYIPAAKSKKTTYREVVTEAPGILLQHDSSIHKWSPYAKQHWVLITTLDDYSRYLLYADLVKEETTWAHIQAVESMVLGFGVALMYYVDNHSIFRYVRRHDSMYQRQIKNPDEVVTQWKVVVNKCNMNVIYALSPQAKGKVERPYRWLQDHIVRRCARDHVTEVEDARYILQQEVSHYNEHQVHSTTGEIPAIRLQNAIKRGNCCFRDLQLPPPYTSTKDIFCLHEQRHVDGYNKVSWNGVKISLPVPLVPGTQVDLNIIPYEKTTEIRIWYKRNIVKVIHIKK